MIYTVTFNPAIDYLAQLDGALCLGGVNRNRTEDVQFGGKGINVSRVLNTLGQDTVALGFIAGFTGAALENGLRAAGLSTDFICVAEGLTRINVKIKASEETEINGIGPVITETDLQKLFRQLETLKEGDYLVLSGSVPGCLKDDIYGQILSRLQGRNISVVVDATKGLLTNTLKYRPFLVKPNDIELGQLLSAELKNREQILAGARTLQRMGARNVLVSMAERGALLLDETGNVHRIACPKGQVVNSVGAGDSMVAGFLAGFLQTGDYGYALRLGTAAGSATAFSLGLADRQTVMTLLDQI